MRRPTSANVVATWLSSSRWAARRRRRQGHRQGRQNASLTGKDVKNGVPTGKDVTAVRAPDRLSGSLPRSIRGSSCRPRVSTPSPSGLVPGWRPVRARADRQRGRVDADDASGTAAVMLALRSHDDAGRPTPLRAVTDAGTPRRTRTSRPRRVRHDVSAGRKRQLPMPWSWPTRTTTRDVLQALRVRPPRGPASTSRVSFHMSMGWGLAGTDRARWRHLRSNGPDRYGGVAFAAVTPCDESWSGHT